MGGDVDKLRAEMRAAIGVLAAEQRRTMALNSALLAAVAALSATHPQKDRLLQALAAETSDLMYDEPAMAQAAGAVLQIVRSRIAQGRNPDSG